jgi:hypothetical protein
MQKLEHFSQRFRYQKIMNFCQKICHIKFFGFFEFLRFFFLKDEQLTKFKQS